jgi:hypothetical protein
MKEKFIPGIYNYCDRWCERCTFTSRCRNYDGRSTLSSDQLDMNNKAFWSDISNSLQKAMELLYKAAKEHGFDPDSITPEEEKAYKERESFIRGQIKQHVLVSLCEKYRNTARPFLNEHQKLQDELVEMVQHVEMGIKTETEVSSSVATIADCIEILQWYIFFIDAKFQRALHARHDAEDQEGESGYDYDSLGSAKIAIISVERCMNAWMRLYELMPSCEDVALESLSILSQLRDRAKEEFPAAMEFKRPGFDEQG